MNDDTKRKILTRLAKIQGQVKGIGRMIENDRYCVDTLHQISAVQGALERVAKETMRRHLESCVVNAFQSKNKTEREKKIEELMTMFSKFGK
ncbi:MAG: metal-sensitive transcriptional regulator [Nitrospira sp.]|nr:transcriptional regulator [Candidatus Manganitrophaceae bacterium]HIL34532.1 transcriptional regulator [Candidatus Manganitrophaceae bacterium]